MKIVYIGDQLLLDLHNFSLTANARNSPQSKCASRESIRISTNPKFKVFIIGPKRLPYTMNGSPGLDD